MHESVLLHESVDFLNIKKDGVYVDLTGGFGGHSQLIFKRMNEDGRLYIVDQDEEALNFLHDKFDQYSNVTLLRGDFSGQIQKLIDEKIVFDGVLADLGLSSIQLDSHHRGFGFKQDGPLDMRMDQSLDVTAEDIVNEYEFDQLVEILFEYGEERFAKRISGFICEAREEERITTVFKLVKIIQNAVGTFYRKQRIHPATRTFQALRIEVNQELKQLDNLLQAIPDLLKEGGRSAIISFHSLEDRKVKIAFRNLKNEKKWNLLTKKPIIPSEDEVKNNPRSRSAKLRVIERV